MGPTVTVEKRKWDGRVCSSEHARLLSTTPSMLAWLVPSGTTRKRPARGTTERLERDELWVTAVDEWWVLCASAASDPVTDIVLHAAAPVEPTAHGIVKWIDLDLDLEVHGGRVSLEDEEIFHRHATTMAYPNDVIRGAWSGNLPCRPPLHHR